MAMTLIEASRLCNKPQGMVLVQKGMTLAISSARRDIECECGEVRDDKGDRWWDTAGGLFLGDSESDREFRAMLMDSVSFLADMDLLQRHPVHAHWVRFVDEV